MIIWNKENLAGRQQPPLLGIALSMLHAATAAFTGHRFVDASQREHVKKRLSNAVLDAYGYGIRNFISGFAIGFDMMAAEAIVSLKRSYLI